MNSFTIKDMENMSGIKAHTIRIWEQRYDFLKPSRSFTNIRYYSNDELKKILNVALLNKYGFKVSLINKMSEVEIKENILSLNNVEAQYERIVNELIQSMIDLDMQLFEKTLDNFIMVRGIEKAVTQIVFPFLEKIGILWVTNHINPAQEHLVSNIIRQKLILGIETVGSIPRQKEKCVLLFLPEAEYHELGLLFMHYLLKSRGVNVIYMGANVPLEDVAFVAGIKKPDYLYCHLTTVCKNFSFDKFLSMISSRIPGIPTIISGQLTGNYEKKILKPIILKRSFAEVMDFVTQF